MRIFNLFLILTLIVLPFRVFSTYGESGNKLQEQQGGEDPQKYNSKANKIQPNMGFNTQLQSSANVKPRNNLFDEEDIQSLPGLNLDDEESNKNRLLVI